MIQEISHADITRAFIEHKLKKAQEGYRQQIELKISLERNLQECQQNLLKIQGIITSYQDLLNPDQGLIQYGDNDVQVPIDPDSGIPSVNGDGSTPVSRVQPTEE